MPLAAAATLVALMVAAPHTWAGPIVVVAVLIDRRALPSLAEVGGMDIRLNDPLLLLALIVAVIRGRRVSTVHTLVPAAVVIGWALARTGLTEGAISFVRVVGPTILLGFVLPRLFRDADTLWRVVRVACVGLIMSAPVLTTPEGDVINPGVTRYSGIVGGPNELGLVAAALIGLGWNTRGFSRAVYLAVGAVGLWQARSISSVLAAALAVIVAQLVSPEATKARRVFSPLLLTVFVPTAVLLVPVLRPDVSDTLSIHLEEARSISNALRIAHPAWGTGWSQDVNQALQPGDVTLHNTYLDWLAYLGLIGLLMLVAWLAVIGRAADHFGNTVLAAALVWLNTSGAFPSIAWAFLGLVAASAGWARLRPDGLSQTDADDAAEAAKMTGVLGENFDLQPAVRTRRQCAVICAHSP